MKRIIKVTKNLNNIGLLSLLLFTFLVLYYSFFAFRSTPELINELDSLGQHIPLAQAILKGEIFNPPLLGSGIGFYMPMGEVILAIFIFFGIPLGLYNVAAIVILFYLCIKLGERVGLSLNTSIVYAFSISFLNTITRLIPTQKNDLYLNVFFIWFLYLLLEPNKKIKHYLLLGISGGLLIGVKYSGIILAAILIVLYFDNLKNYMNRNYLAFLAPLILLGLIWYVRNLYLTSNPFYPVSILGFEGNSNYLVPHGYENLLRMKSSILTLEAFISEYLVWSFIPIIMILALYKRKLSEFHDVGKLLLLGVLSTAIYFLGPTDFTRINITSNMRFLQPAFIVFILITFLITNKIGKGKEIALISLLSSIMILSQLQYNPKLIIVWIIFIMFVLLNKNRLEIV